jgi:hypothetical protein
MKANLQSPCFTVHLLWMANAVRRKTIGIETTGEKQSDLVQGYGSKLPRTMILLLARVGTPFIFFTVKVHMDGMAFIPYSLQICMYSASLITP